MLLSLLSALSTALARLIFRYISRLIKGFTLSFLQGFCGAVLLGSLSTLAFCCHWRLGFNSSGTILTGYGRVNLCSSQGSFADLGR